MSLLVLVAIACFVLVLVDRMTWRAGVAVFVIALLVAWLLGLVHVRPL